MPESIHHELSEKAQKDYLALLEGLWGESYSDEDPARAIASAALYNELSRVDSPLTEPIETFALIRREYDVPEKLNLLHSNFIYFAALEGRPVPTTEEDNRLNIERFAEVYWRGRERTDSAEESKLFSDITYSLFFRELQTTMTSRYSIAEFLMQAHRDRFPNGVSVLDVGSSVGQGLKALALKKEYGHLAFPPVQIVDRDKIDADKSIAYNEMLERPTLFREGVGIDLDPPTNPDVTLWARSNLRHKEHLNKEFMRNYDLFNAESPSNVSFFKGDFTNPRDIEALLEARKGEKFDMVVANTVAYQMARSELRKALEHIPRLLTPKGIALVQDSIEVVGRGLQDLSLRTERWDHWSALAYDNAHPENGWQHIAESNKSRFEKIQLGLGTLAVGGIQQRPTEWLNNY